MTLMQKGKRRCRAGSQRVTNLSGWKQQRIQTEIIEDVPDVVTDTSVRQRSRRNRSTLVCCARSLFFHFISRPSPQFVLPVWPNALHSLRVLKGVTLQSHTITYRLSHAGSSPPLFRLFHFLYISFPLVLSFSQWVPSHWHVLSAVGVTPSHRLHQLINGLQNVSRNHPDCNYVKFLQLFS